VHHNVTLITTIAAALGLALIMGFIAARLKLPPLVGYLIAGIIIGPATPGFVADIELSGQLAEIGVMLLMFGVGLHFSLEDLLAVRRIALPGAIVQITVATLLGIAVTSLWGWSLPAGIVFGLSLSVASTVVLLKALETRGILETVNGRIAVGWLIVEDLVTVLVLVLLPPLSLWLGGNAQVAQESADRSLLTTLAVTLGQVAAFIALMLIAGRRLFPKLLWQIAGTGSRELFTLCVVAAAVGIAYGSSELFGVSFALGAFFAGMVMRESPLSYRAAEESLPLRDAFSVLFFVSVGDAVRAAGIDSRAAPRTRGRSDYYLRQIIGRFFSCPAVSVSPEYRAHGIREFGADRRVLFHPRRTGEVARPHASGRPEPHLAGAIISIAVNPLVFHAIEPAQAWIRSRSKLAQALERPDDPLAVLPMTVELTRLTGQVVLVGYGRIGRRIGDALTANGISFVVAEENREIVEKLRLSGIPAVSGDASDPNVLIQAHIQRARMLVIATPDTLDVRRMIEIARTVNPRIETVVRTHSEEEATLLEKEIAGKVFLGEHELASSMIQHVLDRYAAATERHQ
jgi:K+:H+ antiporter